MMVIDNYTLIGIVAAVAAVLALLVWGIRRRKAVPTPAVSMVPPASKGVNDFNAREYMRNLGMEQKPEKEIHIPKTIQADSMSLFFEEIIKAAANNAQMTFKIKTPEGATVNIFGKDGWKVEGEIEIGGGAVKEEVKPKDAKRSPEIPGTVT